MSKLKRILFRQKKLLSEYASINPKVCMVVWNTFETDARVTKEALTLLDQGKDVTVIAVHQPGRTKEVEVKDGLNIIRVIRTFKKVSNHSLTHSNSEAPKTLKVNDVERKKTSLKSKIRKLFTFVPKWIINIRFFWEAYRQDAGVYHSHDLNTLIPVFLASRLRGAKLIYDAHEVSTDRAGWKNKKYWEFVEGILIRKADEVITTNLTRAEYFKEHYHIPLPKIIKNVPPFQTVTSKNLIREILGISDEVPIILYQGGLQADRGLENMVKMMQNIEFGELVFLGNGSMKEELKKMVVDLKVQNKVHFIDAVPNEDLLNYTASATIGLQLLLNTCFNHYSACSNKLNEYMMAGIPVIASDFPEIRRIVEKYEVGYLVDPENVEEITEYVKGLLNNQTKLAEFKKNTVLAAQNNKWENEIPVLLDIYE